ncbi:MAG TPA: GNAT family N-acetyltransferase [Acidimicrobiales bacterium]
MFLPPEPIDAAFDTATFECGEPALDRWLRRHAVANQVTGRSRTFVVRAVPDGRIAGFYCLSTAVVEFAQVTARVAAGLPRHEPVPAVLLGRLAVDRKHQGQGLGRALVADAIRRTFGVIAANAGVRVLLVQAKNERVQDFYLRLGFEASPTDPLHLLLLHQDVPTDPSCSAAPGRRPMSHRPSRRSTSR